jgi:cation diffusion facilitator family transporter
MAIQRLAKLRYEQRMESNEKQKVALFSIAASAVLAGSKLFAAMATGSLGILSEAIHSLIDLGATIITWFAVRWSDQPADDVHHYGHGKIESIAALVETGLLFITTGWIISEAVRRLLGGEASVEVEWWAIAIIAASIIIDYNRARALSAVAKRTHSEALEADALHFSSDMWSSIAVLVGLCAVWLGFPWADAAAALLVSIFVALAGWRLGKRTLNTLLDAAPEGATERIRDLALGVTGVSAVRRIRLRPAGGTLFAGVIIEVARTLPVDDLVPLKDRVAEAIRTVYPNADVTVTANPIALDDETVFQRVMLIARRRLCAIHHLTVQHVPGGKLAVSFDLEVDGNMSLGDAHEIATGLEDAIRAELGADVEVESHIEPIAEFQLQGSEVSMTVQERIVNRLRELAEPESRMSDVHNIRIRDIGQGLFVHYHCRFSPGDTVDDVHGMIDKLERQLREDLPEICRVVAHAEPLGRQPHRL